MNDRNRNPISETPSPSAAEIQRMLSAELSLPARVGYTALLLTSLTGAAVIGALLLTEPGLPARTQIALAVLVGIGLSWTAFAAWVLTRRRVLLAGHSIIASRMAVAFTAIFTVGAWIIGQWGGTGRTWYSAMAVGLAMLAVATILLVRAHRRFDDLTQRRVALERQLGH